MREPLETAELQAFSQAVEAHSLSRAAAELGLPRATLSRRLARLEERLGARLLKRTTRSLVLTDAGEALYRHARIVLDAVGQAESSVRRMDGAVCGDLRVSVPPIFNESFYELLVEFGKKYPEVRLQVHFSSQHVDLLKDGYDVALRATSGVEPGLVARTLIKAPIVAVASPAYLAEKGVPRSKRDLKQHRCLMGFARGELPQTHWPLVGGGRLQVAGAMSSNEVTFLVRGALSGLGIATLAKVGIESLLQSGALVHVLPGIIGGQVRIALVYPEREFLPPQVRAFIDTVARWAPNELAKGLPIPKELR